MNGIKRVIHALEHRSMLNWLPDELYLKLIFWERMGRKLDLNNPKTFNEKLQWLKLHDRNPEYTKMVDKYEVKKIIATKIGEEYIIPTFGVWDRFEDIDFDVLPDQFVLKCTHDSGGLVICRDKKTFDIAEAKKKINQSLKKNYYYHGREWPYKNVKPRIIAEKYIIDKNDFFQNGHNECLTDYKFFCFHGLPKIMYISQDRAKDTNTDFFDMNYQFLPIRMKDPNSVIPPSKPKTFEKMKELATELCKGHSHIRVDFYNSNGNIYVGELTFYHCSGFARVYPKEWEERLGDWIIIDVK